MLAELRAKPGAAKNEARQIETIVANMERWRWYPRDLGNAHVLVNQPDFTLKVMHNGAPGLDHAHRDRQAQHADAAAERDDEDHHRQSDLDRAAVDRAQRISAGAGAGSDRARAHGPARELQRRRRDDHPAAGRRQCARTHPVQLPQPLLGLSARHAGQVLFRARGPRLQPWLHARAGSGQIRRGPPQHRAPAGALDGGQGHRACSAAASRTSSCSRRRSGST